VRRPWTHSTDCPQINKVFQLGNQDSCVKAGPVFCKLSLVFSPHHHSSLKHKCWSADCLGKIFWKSLAFSLYLAFSSLVVCSANAIIFVVPDCQLIILFIGLLVISTCTFYGFSLGITIYTPKISILLRVNILPLLVTCRNYMATEVTLPPTVWQLTQY
jgi:hypothetical protein